MKKYYGKVKYKNGKWIFEELEPHVSIKLKSLFPKLNETATLPFVINDSDEASVDLEWFFMRYPVKIDKNSRDQLETKANEFREKVEKLERILLPTYKPKNKITFNEGHALDNMQRKAIDFFNHTKRLLLVDPIGSGKTYTAIGSALLKGHLPAAFVVQTHLPKQFKDKIEEITNLTVHVVKTKRPYNLPKADIYIFKYSTIGGWTDIFSTGLFNFVMFDEIQELRHGDSTDKGSAAIVLSDNAEFVLGTTGTPIYGYGIEFFNILDIIKKGSLGTRKEFLREWTDNNEKLIKNTKAFGSFLRESRLMLKRDKSDFPAISEIQTNIIPEKIDYDPKMVKTAEDLAKQLAIKTLYGSFTEQGQAARMLDLQLRETTGISKAKNVANFVRMLVESGEKVLLAGWHRGVYEVLRRELSDLGVVMYTGSETAPQKARSKDSFINGNSNVMIISHASGAGLDGLQGVCSTVVIGELAWSEEIHNQIIGRVARRGQKNIVYAFILISDFGSDPVIQDILGLKYRQKTGILSPNEEVIEIDVEGQKSRLKKLAENYLTTHNFDLKNLENEYLENKKNNKGDLKNNEDNIEVEDF